LDQELQELTLGEMGASEDLSDKIAFDKHLLSGPKHGKPVGVAFLLGEEGLVLVDALRKAVFAKCVIRAEDALVLTPLDGLFKRTHDAAGVLVEVQLLLELFEGQHEVRNEVILELFAADGAAYCFALFD